MSKAHDSPLGCKDHRMRAGGRTKLIEQAFDVSLDGADANAQFARNQFVAASARHQSKDIAFTTR